jgi:predicted PurR-regulated permease PerM
MPHNQRELEDGMSLYAERALVVLASIAVIFLLYWGAPFFIPLLVAVLISYALSPLVDLLTRVVRMRAIAASLVVAGLLGLIGTGAWAWSDDVSALWDRVPEASRALSRTFRQIAQQPSKPMAEMKKAAAEIESLAQTGKSAPPAPATPPPTPSTGSFWTTAWAGGKGILVAGSQTLAVIFLVFFMLASGDLFKRKIVKIAGTTLAQKRITVEVIDEIDAQVRRYLMVVAISNVLVGLGTWLAFRMMGVSYAELWGVVAAILHTAPYFGPALVAAAAFVGGLVQFGDLSQALLVALATIVVATLVGSIFTTWLASKHARLNATATFVGLLFFGWIWGLWGVLLAIPILAIVKTICDYNDEWKPVGELLSN